MLPQSLHRKWNNTLPLSYQAPQPQARSGKSLLLLTDLDGTAFAGCMQDAFLMQEIEKRSRNTERLKALGLEVSPTAIKPLKQLIEHPYTTLLAHYTGFHPSVSDRHAAWDYIYSKTQPPDRIRAFMQFVQSHYGIRSKAQLESWAGHVKPFLGLQAEDYSKGQAFYPHIESFAKRHAGFDRVETGFISLGHQEVGEKLPFATSMQHRYGSRFKFDKNNRIRGIEVAMKPEDKGHIVQQLKHQMKDPETVVVAFGDSPKGGDRYLFEQADIRIGVDNPEAQPNKRKQLYQAKNEGLVEQVFTPDYSLSSPLTHYVKKCLKG
jgi:hydroxymethylpyrimidine pyrophosphatase-like HAD family hydrolase